MRQYKLVAAALAILAIVPLSDVAAQDLAGRISVTGEGQVQTVPDMASITLGVTHEAPVAADAMRATSQSVARMLDRLSDMGIAPRDVQTRQVTLNPVWSNETSSGVRVRKITGFVASNTVAVRVRDLSSLGSVLDAVIQDGANDFNGLRFSVQDPEPLIEEARRRAVAKARAKAEQLADAAGVTLGPVISIDEHGGGRPVPVAEMARMASDSVPIAAGELSLGVSVSMVFAITE